MKRYRDGKIKQEHTIIQGLRLQLDRLAQLDEVITITPGPIRHVRSRAQPGCLLRYQSPTSTGIKCVAKTGRTVQEVYVVTNDPDAVIRAVTEAADRKKA